VGIEGLWGQSVPSGRLLRVRRPKLELALLALNLITYAVAVHTLLAGH
jgi:hypothetical protein